LLIWYGMGIRIFPWIVEVGEQSGSEEGGAVKRTNEWLRKSRGLGGEYGSCRGAVVPPGKYACSLRGNPGCVRMLGDFEVV
jgi:hypothetical protein